LTALNGEAAALARRDGRLGAALSALFLLAALAAAADPAADLLGAARAALAAGDAAASLEALRALRNRHFDSSLLPESWELSVQAALAQGNDYLARSYLHRLSSEFPRAPQVFRAAAAIGDREYARRAWDTALEFYARAAEAAGSEGPTGESAEGTARDRVHLRAAEISLYHARDARAARRFFRSIRQANVEPGDRSLYRALRVRLVWDWIPASELGLSDSNVAALRADGDDLWVGTWNGGVARFSVSAGQSTAFPSPAFTRSIEVTDRRIWVGTADGLAWYGKGSGTWGFSDAWKALVVSRAAGDLYAGTLGDGLFRLRGEEWEQVADGDLPGRFVSCLAEGPGGATLLVGTVNLGLIVVDRATGTMRGLEQLAPGFSARNITSVLADRQGRVWIGTYGEGLFLWTPSDNSLARFSRSTGEIGDDWVLAICETPRALYFGTFGAGVSVYQTARGAWGRFGIADGLASLDVTSIAFRPPYVFFGTLGAGVSVYEEAADVPEL
jgi:hypothetical protein